MIRGLHHNAYRCRDAEKTRVFYEDFLGLPLVSAFERGFLVIWEMSPNVAYDMQLVLKRRGLVLAS